VTEAGLNTGTAIPSPGTGSAVQWITRVTTAAAKEELGEVGRGNCQRYRNVRLVHEASSGTPGEISSGFFFSDTLR